MDACGPPDSLSLDEDKTVLVWNYNAKEMLGRRYAVDFYLLGGWVFGVRCEALNELPAKVKDEFSPAQLGEDLAEILAREGAPHLYEAYRKASGSFDELVFDGRVIRELPFIKHMILENNRVVAFSYSFPETYMPEADVLLAFVRQVDAELLAGLDSDAVWIFRDNFDGALDESVRFWNQSYSRSITTEDMNTDLRASSVMKSFGLGYADRTARGPLIHLWISMRDLGVLHNWEDKENGYMNSGNLEKLQELIKAYEAELPVVE